MAALTGRRHFQPLLLFHPALFFLRMSRRSTGAQVRSKLMGASSASVQDFRQPLPQWTLFVLLHKLPASVQPEVGNVYDLESWTVYYLLYKPGRCDPPGLFLYSCTVHSFFSVHCSTRTHIPGNICTVLQSALPCRGVIVH